MKNRTQIISGVVFLTFTLSILFFSSCKKDESPLPEPPLRTYADLENAANTAGDDAQVFQARTVVAF
jgi:hypothetical protein